MDNELGENFVSLRRALKVCTLVVLAYAFFDLHRAMLILERANDLWSQLMDGKEPPSLADLGVTYFNNLIPIAGLIGLVLAACFIVTKRSRGGAFIYLNVGLFIALGILKQTALVTAIKMMSVPITGLGSG